MFKMAVWEVNMLKVEKQLAKLKAEGLIRRDGSDKGGEWIVLD